MSEYERSMAIHASPTAIYDFVADVRNLPKYLPTTHSAQPQGGERVRVQGEAQGHPYDSDGHFHADPATRRLEWGADEQYYAGWLQIAEHDGGAASEVTVHLAFTGTPPGADAQDAPPDGAIEDGILKALESIKNQVEGHGGKVEPAAAT